MKDHNFRAIINERDKAFQVEIEKSKINLNKLIEEGIRDKKHIDQLEQQLELKDKTLNRLQKKTDQQ